MMCTLIFTIRSRQPVFTFDNEKALFKFQYQKPQLAPLLKLPPTWARNSKRRIELRSHTHQIPILFIVFETLYTLFLKKITTTGYRYVGGW